MSATLKYITIHCPVLNLECLLEEERVAIHHNKETMEIDLRCYCSCSQEHILFKMEYD